MRIHDTESPYGLRVNAVNELKLLSEYVNGIGQGKDDVRLKRAAYWMDKLSRYVCGQGYIGCPGGEACDSDHK